MKLALWKSATKALLEGGTERQALCQIGTVNVGASSRQSNKVRANDTSNELAKVSLPPPAEDPRQPFHLLLIYLHTSSSTPGQGGCGADGKI